METDVWLDFIEGVLYNNYSLEKLADVCDGCIPTALNYKIKVMYAAEVLNKKIMLSETIQADETFVNFNLKGQRFTDVDRAPRKRGEPNSGEEKTKNSICIAVALDRDPLCDRTRIVSRIAGFGNPSNERICIALQDKIAPNKNTVLATDGSHMYNDLSKKHHIKWMRLPTKVKNGKRVPQVKNGYSIQTVNNYHEQIKTYLRNMRGVSTKYLPGHLELFDFCINYRHLRLEDQKMLILKTLLNETTYETLEEIKNRYKTPLYKDQIAKLWNDRFSETELNIYDEVMNGAKRKDICKKYDISYAKMRGIIDRIDKAKNQYYDEIEYEEVRITPDGHQIPNFTKVKFSKKSWDIYVLQRTNEYSCADIARIYNCSRERIRQIIAYIDRTEYAYPIAPKKLKGRAAELAEEREELKRRNEQIYSDYTILASGTTKTLEMIYAELGVKYNMKKYSIRNLIFKMKKSDINAIWRKPGTKIEIDYDHEFTPRAAS